MTSLSRNQFRALIFTLLFFQNHLIFAQSRIEYVEWGPILAWFLLIAYVALLLWIGFKFIFLKNLFQSKLKKGYFRLNLVLSILISIPTFTLGFPLYWGIAWVILWIIDGFKSEHLNIKSKK